MAQKRVCALGSRRVLSFGSCGVFLSSLVTSPAEGLRACGTSWVLRTFSLARFWEFLLVSFLGASRNRHGKHQFVVNRLLGNKLVGNELVGNELVGTKLVGAELVGKDLVER